MLQLTCRAKEQKAKRHARGLEQEKAKSACAIATEEQVVQSTSRSAARHGDARIDVLIVCGAG